MESRDPNARETAATLRDEFRGRFKALYATLHPLQEGEVAGKSSNENYAVRCAKRRLCDELGILSERIVVTVCDADTYFHDAYFSALSRESAGRADRGGTRRRRGRDVEIPWREPRPRRG